MPAQDRVRHFRRFIRKGKIDTVQVLLPVPLPGTETDRRRLEQAAPDLRPSGRGAGNTTTGISRSLSPMTP